MLKNYLKVAWRSLMKNKVFSIINVFGLSVGLACCMLIGLYLWHETSYDSYHKNIDRLYQVGTTVVADGKETRMQGCPSALAATFKLVFPQVVTTARLCPIFENDKTLMQYHAPGEVSARSFYEEKGFFADSGFFNLFSYHFIEGNPATAMNDPYSIVLSREIADNIFGNQSALNKVVHISVNGDHDYVVTGVFAPGNIPSHIDARFFLSLYGGQMGDFVRKSTNMAGNFFFNTYILLQPGANPHQLESQFPAFVEKYEGKDLKAAGFNKKQFLLPVRDIHLHADMPNGDITPLGSVTYLYILASIALFTLLIACINFMNLATARSTKRSSEVGIRKTLGANRSSLILQFLGESLLITLISFVIAIFLAWLLIPSFEKMSGKTIHLSLEVVVVMLCSFLLLSVVTGLIAGSYPAFYLSSFQPVKVLKGKTSNSLAVISLRKGLVVFQFFISIVLIIASVVIGNQMHFLRHADLGFEKDQQMVIPLRGVRAQNMYTSLKSELERNTRVISVGASLFYPGITNSYDGRLYSEGKTNQDNQDVNMNYVDFDFLKTLHIPLSAGRLYSSQFPADSVDGIILNEEAIRRLGYVPASSIGKKVYTDIRGKTFSYTIVGVVKDFHFQDLHSPIGPICFLLNSLPQFNYVIAHVRTEDLGTTIASIRDTWHNLNPDEPLEYTFMDEQFQKNYEADYRLSSIIGYSTAVAICISCLGLFGLAAFSAEQRTREIGIRKVLGAKPGNIAMLLSVQFLRLVAISVLIGSPVGWFVMHKWLQDFAFRTAIGWTVFAYTAVASILIALFAISFQVIRATIANPIKSLRSDS